MLQTQKNNTGFSIVKMLVAIFAVSLLVVIAVGAYLWLAPESEISKVGKILNSVIKGKSLALEKVERVDKVSTPSGEYHHRSKLHEIVIGPHTSKRITIYGAGTAVSNEHWNGASSGITGFYIPKNDEFFDYGTGHDAKGKGLVWVKGVAAVIGNLGYNNYDRVWGGHNKFAYGYWNWGDLQGRGFDLIGMSGTYDGLRVDFLDIQRSGELSYYISTKAYPWDAPVLQLRLTNTTDQAKTLNTLFGQPAQVVQKGGHGVSGGTLFNGLPDIHYKGRDFIKTKKFGKFNLAMDGYIVIKDTPYRAH